MREDILVRRVGRAGRITLNRPEALNALTYDMCLRIEAALDTWKTDDQIALVVIDAVGERAFSAGGDIAVMYETGRAGDFAYGRKFWADEYRMNAKVFNFPKPYVAFMQGYTMGGGVGVSCHGSHRVVGDSSRIAMPECGIGLIPDVGGSFLLAHAPGHLGEYLGTTGTRMGPGDAIHAGFADYYIPEAEWPALISTLEEDGDCRAIENAARPQPPASLADRQSAVDEHFAGASIFDIVLSLEGCDDDFCTQTLAALRKHSPLSVACTIEVIHRVRGFDRIEPALEQEYHFTWRAAESGDFLEGIRAAIIDKDRAPKWRHKRIEDVTESDMQDMLKPLPPGALEF